MALQQSDGLKKLIIDVTDAAFKTVLIAGGTADQADTLAIGELVKSAVDTAVANNTVIPEVIPTVEAFLVVTADALILDGKTALAADVEEGEVLLGNYSGNGGNTVLAGLKTAWDKVFFPKKYAAAVAAGTGTNA